MKAKLVALRLLGIKGRTVFELRKKLSLKGFSPQEVEEAIADCIRLGYVDDVEEGRRRVERLKKRGYGPRYIAAKLKAEGVSTPSISLEEEKAMIRDLIQKPAWRKKEKKKLAAALQRRGFSIESILETIS